MQRNLIRGCSQSTVHVYLPPFKIPYSYCNGNTCFFSGGSRNFLLRGGVQTLVQKGLLNFLVATSPPKPLPLPLSPSRTSSHQSRLHVIIPWPFTVYLNSTCKEYIIVDQLRTQTETTMSICEHWSLLAREMY